MKIIVNRETLSYETIEAFKDRFRRVPDSIRPEDIPNYRTVSFGPVLDQELVSSLDENAVIVDIGEQPKFDPDFQRCYIRQPFIDNDKLIANWVVENKTKEEVNEYYNARIEAFIDSKAQSLLYTNQDRMVSYIGDADPQTDREARFMRDWRSNAWAVAKSEIKKVFELMDSSPITKPMSADMIIAKFPEFTIPDNY